MTFIVPVMHESLDFEKTYEYVLAKLEFLLVLFRNKEKAVQNQVALIVQFLPDFFYFVGFLILY